MSRHIVDTIRIPGSRLKAVIEYDEDCEAPYADDDGVRIVILHRKYSNPSKECGTTPDEVQAWCEENAGEWFIAPLWMYEHSGVALRAGASNPFSCQWDSGGVGIVALKRSEWGRQELAEPEREAALLDYAKGVAEIYGRWMNGECYGYSIVDPRDASYDGDSCWGYVGLENVQEAAKDALEYAAKDLKEQEDTDAARLIEANRPDMMGDEA